MKRMVIALAAVVLLALGGTAASAFAAPSQQTPQPQQGWTCPGWGGTFGTSGAYNPADNPTVKQLADKLGLSADALVNELKAGKSVADVAKAQNVDEQVLVDTLVAPIKDMMDLRVKYGYLTQDQANQAVSNAASAIKYRLEQKGYLAGGFGGTMGGFGGHMGGYGPGYGPGMMGGYGPATGSYGPAAGGFGGMMGRFFGRTN